MKKRKYIVKEKVWLWPGIGGWHFITLPKNIFTEIRTNFGLGMIPVTARIGKTSWKTALFPHKQSGAYLISIKKNIRKEEDIFEGDIISVNFEII